MDGIAVGRDDKSKSIIFYNPIASSYYHLPDFCLDESRLPITNFPNSFRFDGSLTCGLLRNKTYPVHENFPPGTHVSIQYTDALTRGTINNIPLLVSTKIKYAASTFPNKSDDSSISSEIPESPPYVILMDSGTTVKKSYGGLIQCVRDDVYPSSSTNNAADLEGIPHFLRHDSKVTMCHKGDFHKGYINYSP